MKDNFIEPSRRQFLQLGAMATAAFKLEQSALANAVPPAKAKTMINVPFAATKDPRIGFIGVGGRGTGLLGWFVAQNAQVVAVCDVVPEKAEHASQMVVKAGQKAPELYTKGPHDYESLTKRSDHRFGGYRYPVELAYSDGALLHGKRQARRRGGTAGLHHGRFVEAGGHLRSHAPALHHAGGVLLWLHRDPGAEHGASRCVGRRSSMERPPTCTICAKRCSRTRAKVCGAALFIR